MTRTDGLQTVVGQGLERAARGGTSCHACAMWALGLIVATAALGACSKGETPKPEAAEAPEAAAARGETAAGATADEAEPATPEAGEDRQAKAEEILTKRLESLDRDLERAKAQGAEEVAKLAFDKATEAIALAKRSEGDDRRTAIAKATRWVKALRTRMSSQRGADRRDRRRDLADRARAAQGKGKLPKGVGIVSAPRLKQQMGEGKGIKLYDVRREEQFERSHIDGAESLSLRALRTRKPPRDADVVLYGKDARDPTPMTAAKRLADEGYQKIRVLDGGLRMWRRAKYPTKTLATGGVVREVELVAAKDLDLEGTKGLVVIDVRDARDYAKGHVPGSQNMTWAQLRHIDKAVPVDASIVLVSDNTLNGQRAGRFLMARGRSGVRVLDQGFSGWRRAGRQVAKDG